MKEYVSCLCHRYEDEINKRNNLENDFVILKKVSISQTHTHIKMLQVWWVRWAALLSFSFVLIVFPLNIRARLFFFFFFFSVHQFSPPSVWEVWTAAVTVSSLVLFNLCVSECFLVCVCVCSGCRLSLPGEGRPGGQGGISDRWNQLPAQHLWGGTAACSCLSVTTDSSACGLSSFALFSRLISSLKYFFFCCRCCLLSDFSLEKQWKELKHLQRHTNMPGYLIFGWAKSLDFSLIL